MLNYKNINFAFLTLCIVLFLLSFFITVQWWYFLIPFGIRFIILLIGSSSISSNFHVEAHCSNPQEREKKIALTFDDGPHPITPQILNLLDQYNAKATFFCIGKNIENHPDILKKIDDSGHIIGNHSYSHSHFFDFYRKDRVIDELEKTNAIIEKIIGKKANFFRPPYGVTNPSIARALKKTKHKVIGWNIRSLDGVVKNEKILLNRIKKRVSPGGIVLLHDTSLHTVHVLEQLLLFLQQNNYTIVSIEELLNLKAYED